MQSDFTLEYRDGDEYEDDDYVVVMDEDEYKSISEYGSEHDYNYDDEDEWNADWDSKYTTLHQHIISYLCRCRRSRGLGHININQ